MTTETEIAVACPKCGGKTWDNRATKRNPKAPDYKCRDQTCDGVVWPKNGAAPRAAAPAARPVRQPISDGGPLPWEQQETGAPPMALVPEVAHRAIVDPMLVQVTKEYIGCLAQAQQIAIGARLDTLGGDMAAAVTAIAATLFIELNKRARV